MRCSPDAIALMIAAAAMPGLSSIATAQEYPHKPIRLITSEPGSSLDLTARVIAQRLTASLGQQVIVDNRRMLAVEIVAKAPNDGYTLLAYGSPMWIAPLLRKDIAYDPVRDFAPITLAVSSPNVLVTNPRIAAKSVRELVALAKTKPAQLNYGSSVTGGSPRLAAELFNSMAGVNLTRIAYKGVAQAVNDLIGGQIDLMFPVVATGMPHARAGRLRALAVTSAQPWPLTPELPTIAASGLPGYELISLHGVLAPANTSKTIMARLNREIVQIINRPDIQQKFLASGAEVIASTAQQFSAVIATDRERMAKLIRDRNIQED